MKNSLVTFDRFPWFDVGMFTSQSGWSEDHETRDSWT